ncbi:MAG: subtilisin-like serine [Bacteroidetes bacterium]|nr:MAG: subtilisin-like serine [Bacteroidota bacterium]
MKPFKSFLTIIMVLSCFILNGQTLHQVGTLSLLESNGQFYRITADDTTKVFPDKILLKFKDGVTPVAKTGFANNNGLTFIKSTLNGVCLYTLNQGSNFIGVTQSLSTSTLLEFFDLNYLYKTLSNFMPPNNDIDWFSWSPWWAQENIMWPYTETDVYGAWNITKGSPYIIVANLDNGISLTHPDLGNGSEGYSNIWINYKEIPGNGIDDDDNGYIDDYYGWNFGTFDNLGNNDVTHPNPDLYSHGSMTGSIIAAKTNNGPTDGILGVFGIAGGWGKKGVSLMNVKISSINDEIQSANIPFAIEYACSNGARVVNMAWGETINIQAIEDEILYWYNVHDVVFLAAAGNENDSRVIFPASSEYVIAVGATEKSNYGGEHRWEFPTGSGKIGSNWGDGLEIMAPGSPICISPMGVDEYFLQTTDDAYSSTSAAVSFASGVVSLMLSANPCLTPDEIRDILKETADKITGGVLMYQYDLFPDRPGFSYYMGYGRINAGLALANVAPGAPITISGVVSPWTTDRNIYHNITIEPNGVLEINNCEVSFAPDVKIIVQQGGRLIVNNSVLTGLCDGIWQGIEVWGNSSANQWPDENGKYSQGYVVLDSATIENAVNALNLWKPGDHYQTGGIVHATGSTFKDNVKSVHALLYRNSHPINEKEMEYNSSFSDCNFEITADYNGTHTFYKHVDLNQVNGIKFKGCDFSLSPDANNLSNYNQAIAAYNAGFKVEARCTGLTTPCNAWDKSTFNGFRVGVYAAHGTLSTYSYLINRALFTGNSIGVLSNNVDNAIVINSDFYSAKNQYNWEDCTYGIFVESGAGFTFEENKFFKQAGAPLSNYIGIGAFNCETVSDIYKNEFTGLTAGNLAFGKNYEGIDPYRGLEYLCNTNTGNWADFYVKGKEDDFFSGIQSKQGSTLMPARNQFSPTGATWHFYNETKNLIGYYYCQSCPGHYPAYVENVTREPVSVSGNCLSHYGSETPSTSIVLSTASKLTMETAFAFADMDFNSVKVLYNDLKDGGSTAGTISDISQALPSDMMELRARLLGDSPHLTTEVLKLVADRTDVFTEAAIFDILAANPDELKKEELMKYLEEKENPLPDYMISILKQVAEGTSYRTVLEMEMAKYSHDRSRAAGDMIRSILNDEELDVAQLRLWLTNLGGIEAERQIIASYAHAGDFTLALALAETLPQTYQLAGDDLTGHNQFVSVLQMQQNLVTSGRNIDQLTQSEQDQLRIIAEADNAVSAPMAKAVLESFYGADFSRCKPIDGTSSYKSQPANPNQLAVAYGLSIIVKPNPAKEWAAFDYTLPEGIETASLEIADANGKHFETIALRGNRGQQLVDIRAWIAGQYIYTLKVAGFTQSGKLVVVK